MSESPPRSTRSKPALLRMAADPFGQLEPPLFPHDPNVIAVAADHLIEAALPVLDLNAPAKIAEFISTRLGLV